LLLPTTLWKPGVGSALLSPPPQPRLLLVAAAVLLVAVAGASALEAARELHALLDYARAVGTS